MDHKYRITKSRLEVYFLKINHAKLSTLAAIDQNSVPITT